MVRAETKRASRNARFTRTRNALEHALRSCEISNANNFSLAPSQRNDRRERARKNERNDGERRQRRRACEYAHVFTKICMIIVWVFVCVSVRHKSGEKGSISNVLHFVGENDINMSRTQRDRNRASLSPNSKATTQDCFPRRFFPSRAKK